MGLEIKLIINLYINGPGVPGTELIPVATPPVTPSDILDDDTMRNYIIIGFLYSLVTVKP